MTRSITSTFIILLITLGTLLTTGNTRSAPESTLELAAIEAWLHISSNWIGRGWQLANDVRAAYGQATPNSSGEHFDSSLVPEETKQHIRDLLGAYSRLHEQWRSLAGGLAVQTAVDPTDADLWYLDQLLKAQFAAMTELSSMLNRVLPDGMVDPVHFELRGEIAGLWQVMAGMLIRQLQENSVPIFWEPL